MKITENPDGTYTLDPGRVNAELVEKIREKDRKINELSSNLSLLSQDKTRLEQELKLSRDLHHVTTNELRDLKKKQEPAAKTPPVPLNFDPLLQAALDILGGKTRKQ